MLQGTKNTGQPLNEFINFGAEDNLGTIKYKLTIKSGISTGLFFINPKSFNTALLLLKQSCV